MREALVPVDGCVEDFDREQRITINSDIGAKPKKLNLTKEDIETMAATLFKETSDPGYCHLTRADTKRIAAAMAVSIGLEVED